MNTLIFYRENLKLSNFKRTRVFSDPVAEFGHPGVNPGAPGPGAVEPETGDALQVVLALVLVETGQRTAGIALASVNPSLLETVSRKGIFSLKSRKL